MNYTVKVLELSRHAKREDKARPVPALNFVVAASNIDQARVMARKHVEKDLHRVLRGLACTVDGCLAAVLFAD